MRNRAGTCVVAVLTAALVAGCAGAEDPGPADPTPAPRPSGAPATTGGPTATPTPSPSRQPRASADEVRVRTAVRAVEHLAGDIGPRPGHTPAYFEAADWVQSRLRELGWQVRRQRFPTPAGVSWGVPVEAGPSVNLVASRGDVEPGEPWLAVGAHLDTVPQAPGAEDNASGIGVLLAVAEAVAERRTRLPVVLIAFGSEEPRGSGEDDHHYGSRAFVAEMSPAQRRSLRAMVSLDRVGVGTVVPVQTVGEPNAVSGALRAAARRVGVSTDLQPFEVSSDHESFADAGLPAARLGSTPYSAYHSEDDLPSVVDPRQLERTARIAVAWLR